MAASLGGCSDGSSSPIYTLYRNSSIDATIRIHWAKFDARESGALYNMNNCMMGVRLLNSNIKAFAVWEDKEPLLITGFWCELDAYSKEGQSYSPARSPGFLRVIRGCMNK